MINKYIQENEYGFERYKEIAIENHKIQLPDNFSKEQKENISIFIGYTLAYVIYLNNKIAIARHNQEAIVNSSSEAKKLLKALNTQTINHISFNLTDKKEIPNKSEALTIKDTQTLNEILKIITPILKEQIALGETKIDVRIGTEKNSFRKKILISLTPLMRYLKHETSFSEKSWEEIARWILDFLKTMIVEKYTELQLDDESYFTLVDYERKNRQEEYIMIRV